MQKVIKRDGTLVPYDGDKIRQVLKNANADVAKKDRASEEDVNFILNYIESLPRTRMKVDEIQDIIENQLVTLNKYQLAKNYITYRFQRDLIRKSNTTDQTIRELLDGTNEYWKTENSNKNDRVVTTQRDYIAGITSTDISKRFLLPKEVVKAHDEGIIHFHDMDYFAQNALHNCDLINLDDMLQNGTNINGVMIEKPHKLLTATTIATQIITAVASSQYGGCSINISDLAPFVRDSYIKYVKEGLKYFENKSDYKLERFDKWLYYNGSGNVNSDEFAQLHPQVITYANDKIKQEINAAVQTFNYQINSMSTTNGQAPFLTVFMYLNERPEYKKEIALLTEEFLKQRILGMKNDKGVYVTPAFPKLIYVLEEDNIKEDSEYFYLTQLAAKCSAKRLVPDYISEKVMKQLKVNADGSHSCYAVMGCRSALTPDRFTWTCGNIAKAKNFEPNKPKFSGRFNQGVVTISLPDLALSSGGDMKKFWRIFNSRLELCHTALRCRHERLLDRTSDMAPILWQNGALARLEKGEKINKLLYNGYSTISLGYAGLYECVKYMTGHSHTEPEGKEFGLAVMQKLNDACAKWKAKENIDYSVYGTPIESTTYKFAKCLKKRFGDDVFVKLDGKDRNYITNSYHVPVFEEIDAFDKLKLESEFQRLSPGGAISYIETPNLQNNPEAVIEVMKFIYDNIMYAELNTKSDYCQKCGSTGEIQMIEDGKGKLIWKCPVCGNTDMNFMNIARRVCGYISTNAMNQGRMNEIKERVIHLDNKEI